MKLYPFIGFNEEGELRVHVSPFRLNKLSPMHERGKPFPDGADEVIIPEDVPNVLKEVINYFNDVEKKNKKK